MNTSVLLHRLHAACTRPVRTVPGLLRDATFVLLAALGVLGPATAGADSAPRLRVMTQNLYLGSFYQEFNAARTADEFVAAATVTYQKIIATRPAERAVALADLIARQRPDFVDIHQAAILRTGTAPPATAVTVDMLQVLLTELAAKGIRYTTVALVPGLDAEVPTALGFNVRVTLRDAMIMRSDLADEGRVRVSNLHVRHYAAVPRLVTPFGVFGDTEGYAAVDIDWYGRAFRLVTTHFDLLPSLAVPQVLEMVKTAAGTELPVVLVCDANSNADVPSDPLFPGTGYQMLHAANFVDAYRTARPADPGYTFGQFEDLLNFDSTMSRRIDVVLFRGPMTVEDAQVVGTSPTDRARLGLWLSDHGGVVATLRWR